MRFRCSFNSGDAICVGALMYGGLPMVMSKPPPFEGPKNMADAIPQEYMKTEGEVLDQINLQEIYNAFSASSSHLFKFVMSYNYHKKLSADDRILFFCQIASQYAEGLNFTNKYETSYDVEYPLIYSK